MARAKCQYAFNRLIAMSLKTSIKKDDDYPKKVNYPPSTMFSCHL
uniref:Uncharacterized protein n=1 Tax=Nelumbo nucifera TaxID=4432 RepID=A0A822Z1E7_NELNU|nr:TPA_asm: hypothetical protein HUJ06_014547 [Nelumbo nucifera]